MSKFFVREKQIFNNSIEILDDDVNHIKNVLRLNVGEEIKICNQDSSKNYNCKILEISSKKVICEIIEELNNKTEGNVELYIFQGLPKADKMELIIQKGTELGVTEFIPVNMKRCIVKFDKKDEIKKIERWNKISEVAAKQSGRDIIPKVRSLENVSVIENQVKDFDLFLVAYEMEKDNYIKNELKKLKSLKDNYKIAVLIGPEGGLDLLEVEKLKLAGAKVISLGTRILRTETVALQVSSIIMYELENGGK